MTKRNKQFANMEDLIPLMKEALSMGKSFRFSPKGISMLPLIRQNRDSVILSPIDGPLKKYDIPLYQREDGKYILHRIVDIEGPGRYTCMGDNQFVKEYGVRQEQMIAVVTGFYRGKKLHRVEEGGHQLYCRIWYHSRHCRRLAQRIVRKLRRYRH